MKICIYGAGAIGGYLAAGLSKVDGVELSLVARGVHLQAIRARGLTLQIGGEERVCHPRATNNPAELGPQDYVIVCVKAHQAWEAAEQMTPLLGDGTAVVTGQNGVPWWYTYGLDKRFEKLRLESVDPGARQWNTIGPQRALGCIVYPATEIVGPGVIRHTYGDRFSLGEPDGSDSERCRRLSQALKTAGFDAPIVDNIRNELWLKLWGNLCFNPISALTRATLDVVTTQPDLRALCVHVMTEAQEVATAFGVSFRVDLEKRIRGASRVGAHRTSMLQDLENGRPLELDALLTAVSEMARFARIETPYIDVILTLTQQLGRALRIYPVYPQQRSAAEPARAEARLEVPA
ncbi:MAG: 2-dehydropantoate 2-reductase [Xanthobacteraceae bacterium]|uniref:2-dehydropantoate 2-reductase n=1 Tax=Pseudolabrys sp. TaxID=1960880 RepID=UPI003D0CD846